MSWTSYTSLTLNSADRLVSSLLSSPSVMASHHVTAHPAGLGTPAQLWSIYGKLPHSVVPSNKPGKKPVPLGNRPQGGGGGRGMGGGWAKMGWRPSPPPTEPQEEIREELP